MANETIKQYFHEVSHGRLYQLRKAEIVNYVITGINDETHFRRLRVKFATSEALLECRKRVDARLTVIEGASNR